MVQWQISHVDLQHNGSAVLTIDLGGLSYGSWAELSGYLIQEDTIQGEAIQAAGTFVPFSAVQLVPDPASGVTSVTVNVAAAGLQQGKNIKAITRVVEMEIWPTVLQNVRVPEAEQGNGIDAAWQALAGNPASSIRSHWAGPPAPGPAAPVAPPAIVELSGPGPSLSLKDLQPGRQYRITIEAVDPE